MKLVRLALVLVLVGAIQARAATQIFIDFYMEPRQAEAIAGPGGSTYVWPGSALSAHVQTLWFNLGLPTAQWVRAVIIWNPRGNANNGVRLAYMDDGPTNLTTLYEVTGSTATTPIVGNDDVTIEWNALVSGLTYKHIGYQTKGNPYVYKVTIEVVNY
jgi:3-methyladenine DNA glycosylase Mpg